MFPGAKSFKIDHSSLTSVVNNNYSTGPTGIDILLEASIPEAAHDSSAHDPPPRCSPGTRAEYVEDIVHWAIPSIDRTPPPLYWMKGPAGLGKSAVAQTCVENLKRLRKRCPAFFFSINGRNKPQKFFPSIAYQLATINSDYHDLIDKKIRRDKTLVDKTMEAQLWGLLIEPLQELEEMGKGVGERLLGFVDDLDECENREAQCEIIEIIASASRDSTPLCWSFFSRPEPHIEASFSKASISALCHSIILPISRDADGDIELYMRAGFESIFQRLNVVTDGPWPSDKDMKKLVRAAGGLFIYAKTVIRFVGQPDSFGPDELLRAIITVISNRNQHQTTAVPAFTELDAFYLLIMQRIPIKILSTAQRILALLCRSSSSGVLTVANILGLSRIEFEIACNQLNAVVHFQRQYEPLKLDPTIDTSRSFLEVEQSLGISNVIRESLGGSISFYHKSFQDFLRDPSRSGVYYVDDGAVAKFNWEAEWNLVRRFQNSHCWQGSELVRAPGAPDSTSNLPYPYTNELISSLIEARIYSIIYGQGRPFRADFDFRKQLYIVISTYRSFHTNKDVFQVTLYQCVCFRKCVHSTVLCWLQPGKFANFDIAAFKKRIEAQQQRNIIEPYHPTSPTLLNKSQGRTESGLYIVGHGSKSIFWYWEIDYDLETFRQFETPNLDEGERLYQGECFEPQVGS